MTEVLHEIMKCIAYVIFISTSIGQQSLVRFDTVM